MEEEIRQYRADLLIEIQAGALSTADYERTRFVERACEVLQSGEEFTDYGLCRAHARWKRADVRIDGYSLSESDGVLSLILASFSGAEEPEPIRTDELRGLVDQAHNFLQGSVYGEVASLWDESHEAHALSREVSSFSHEILTKARIYIVSDRPAGNKLGRIQAPSLGAKEVEVQLWDIERLARAEMSNSGREAITIDFAQEYGTGIAALPALSQGTDYRSFLCVMPGNVLASLYDRFGGRILEQNVRAFLGEGRKVNKGLRQTLREAPSMFFAYNNGLTATVSELALETNEAGMTSITSVTDFQVVNGGQTTASLYWARKAGFPLENVSVQMKLSQLPEEGFEEAVHDIARFANAQNAVSASDLFAGHPYFKRIESLSRQALAPPAKVGEIGSYWFFERTQGSYNVELKRKKGLAAKTWELIHPRKQRITKTDIARFEVTWASIPHSVCSGAQKNTAAFAKIIGERWAKNPEAFDVDYYKTVVAKAILTRSLDGLVPSQEWYPGSMLRQLVTYTIALMSDRLSDKGLSMDFEATWKAQAAPSYFVEQALRTAKEVVPYLQDIPPEQVRNRLVTEWAKREACWLRIQESSIALSEHFVAQAKRQTSSKKKSPWPQRAKALWADGTWKRLHEWEAKQGVLSVGERDMVERAAIAQSFGFKGFRLQKLQEAWENAVRNGFA
ncbi:MAG: AIPR family protein [Lysobacteraceae bacterium]